MATRTRVVASGKPAAGLPAEPDPVEVLAVTTRLLARLIVHASGRAAMPGSFRSIVTRELRIGTDADVDLLEAWLTNHPGG